MKNELIEKAYQIRLRLMAHLQVVKILMKSHAAREHVVGQLLHGKKK